MDGVTNGRAGECRAKTSKKGARQERKQEGMQRGGGWRRTRRQHTRSCAPGTPPCRFGRKLVPSRTLGRVSASSHALTRDPRGGCYPGREFAGAPRCNHATRRLEAGKAGRSLAPASCAGNIRTRTESRGSEPVAKLR